MATQGLLPLRCSVCSGRYFTVRNWLGHFLEDRHQDRARNRLVTTPSWGGDGEGRERALLLYSDKPVDADGRILKYFSKHFFQSILVTDFVWWPERPCLGFIQFGSREMVRKVMTSLPNQLQLQVQGQLFQFKEAAEISDLEWAAHFPIIPKTEPGAGGGGQQDKMDSLDLDLESVSSTESFFSSHDSISSTDLELEEDGIDWDYKRGPVKKKRKLENRQSTLYFHDQLEWIKNLMQVTNQEHASLLQLIPRLEQQLSDDDGKGESKIKAVLSRSWLLKLKYPMPNSNDQHQHQPFIWTQQKKSRNCKPAQRHLSCVDIHSRLCRTKNGSAPFPSVSRIFPPGNQLGEQPPFLIYSLEGNGDSGTSPLPTQIKLAGGKHFNREAQLWELIKYLCTFDSRCEPFLAVLYYWASLNSIQITDFKEDEECGGISISDPFGITWLAILFLCRRELLPKPETILRRQSRTIVEEDKEFKTSWLASQPEVVDRKPEQFAKDVFKLVAQFFLSCGHILVEGEWVIDSGSGKLLTMKEVMMEGGGDSLFQLRFATLKNCGGGGSRLYLTDPFSSSSRINLSSNKEPYRAMIRTGIRLDQFLQTYEEGADVVGRGRFMELLKI